MPGNQQKKEPIYTREPIKVVDGIPMFVEPDEYTENYEQIARDELDAISRNGENPFIPELLWQTLEQSTAQLIEKYAKPDANILDAGVGLGRLLARFPQFQRYGVDVSLQVLRQAREQGINVCCASLEDMPYAPKMFDLVSCTDVLEHVLDLNSACRNLLDVLKDDGILIVRVPYREDLRFYLAPENPYKFVHMRSFDEWSLRLQFERVLGQQVVEWTTAGYVPMAQWFKYVFPIPKQGWLVNRFGELLMVIQRIRPAWYTPLVRIWFRPLVINVVIRKQPRH